MIHVGANSGQERQLYDNHDLEVVWIEPVPATFERLRANLTDFPKQCAYRYLITDEDGREYTFHLANNEEASSSILPFGRVQELYPEISYTSEIRLTSTTLGSFVLKEQIDLSRYQALLLDTQGSELMILKGAMPILDRFHFVKVEVADFEAYEGCCVLCEMDEFMHAQGFRQQERETIRSLAGVGSYYDITYKRR